jgi:hypothetical protein
MSRACFVCIFLRIIIPFSLPAFLGFDQLVEFSRGIVLEAHSKRAPNFGANVACAEPESAAKPSPVSFGKTATGSRNIIYKRTLVIRQALS